MGLFGRKKKQGWQPRVAVVHQKPDRVEEYDGKTTVYFEDGALGEAWELVAEQVAVKGVSRHKHAAVVARSRNPGVALVPEPDNAFDPNAIRVVGYDDEKPIGDLGYLPAEISEQIVGADVIAATWNCIYPPGPGRDGSGFRLDIWVQ